MTTFEPGAKLVFTQGFAVSPRSTAFFASKPAPSISDGFEVFVQLVIAAITTEPSASSNLSPLFCTLTCFGGAGAAIFRTLLSLACSGTLSCGRFGPASVGTTLREIEFQRSEKIGSGVAIGAEDALFLGVRLDELALLAAARPVKRK